MFRDGFVHTDITLSLIRGELRVFGYKLKGSVDTIGLTWKKKEKEKEKFFKSDPEKHESLFPLLHRGEKKIQSLVCVSVCSANTLCIGRKKIKKDSLRTVRLSADRPHVVDGVSHCLNACFVFFLLLHIKITTLFVVLTVTKKTLCK